MDGSTTTTTMDVTPAYGQIFRHMIHEAENQSDALVMFGFLECREQAQALRSIQRFLAPLNIAAQCMTDGKSVEQFRDLFNRILRDIDKTAMVREDMAASGKY